MYPKVTLNQSKTEIWIQVDAQSNPFAVKIEDILAAQSMGGMGRVLTIADLAISLHDEITS